jgi:hypothetical protein
MFDIYGEGLAAAREWQDDQRAGHDIERGNWLLHELAEQSDGRLVEISPGCFYESKLPDGGIESSSYGR